MCGSAWRALGVVLFGSFVRFVVFFVGCFVGFLEVGFLVLLGLVGSGFVVCWVLLYRSCLKIFGASFLSISEGSEISFRSMT